MPDACQTEFLDLFWGNLEAVFLVFTKLKLISPKNKGAAGSAAGGMPVFNREFNRDRQIERFTLALRHRGGKLGHELVVIKVAKLLYNLIVIVSDQHIMGCPPAVPSARSGAVAGDHPKDSPLGASPTAQEKLLVF